jgi:hypothetical protein
MLLLNFAHPITPDQLAAIEALTGQAVARIIDIPSQVDVQQPLGPQVTAMADAAGLTSVQWQTEPLLVNPPALNFSAAALLAELHGRMGYFPPLVRLRPLAGSLPRRFEVAEIMDLQSLREAARQLR